MVLLIILLVICVLSVLAHWSTKSTPSPKTTQQDDELITVILPTIDKDR